MNKSSGDPTTSRPLRSNTDKTSEKPPEVLKYPVEQGQDKKSKSRKNSFSDSSIILNSEDVNPESKESENPKSEELHKKDLTKEIPIQENPIPEPKVKVIWEEFEFELKADADFFLQLESPFIPKIYRPVMADFKYDLEDDRATLTDRIAAIQLILDGHAPAPPTAAVPMSKELVDMSLEDLHAAKAEFDQIQKRTRRVFRGSSVPDLNQVINLNNDLLEKWKQATLHAHKIKLELQAQVISRVKIPKAEPPSFDGKSTNWPAFLDQFNSMVVNNNQVSSTDKLALLKKSLEKGSAHHIVQNFPLTDIDWTNAWAAVKSRYNHEREIAYSHISKLFDLTPITFQSQILIRTIIDTVNEVIRALNNLKVETDKWDLVIIYIIRKNLDNRTRTDFEKSLPDDKLHSLQMLLDFLNTLAAALGIAGNIDKSQKPKESKDIKSTKSVSEDALPSKGNVSTEQSKTRNVCVFCSQTHGNFRCPTLVPLTPQQRIKLAGEKKLCKNCLKVGSERHKSTSCRLPPCGVNGCQLKHHSLLHMDAKVEIHSATVEKPKSDTTPSLVTLSASENSGLNVLLSTAVVNVTVHNKTHKVRALIDQGSQVNLVTEKLANMLKLKRKPSTVSINGIGNSKPNFAKGSISLEIQSRIDSDWKSHINCYILSEVTGDKPSHQFDPTTVDRFKNLKLADENFNVPGPVDIILGAQVFLDILGNNHFKGFPTALDTKLGYVITGAYDSVETESVSTLTCDINFDLTRFWKQEEVPQDQKLSPDEQEAEDNFRQTHVKEENGKFTVALPFISDRKPLGESRYQAEKRLLQIERKLEKYPDKKTLYHAAMHDYISEGYVTEISSSDIHKPLGKSYYLPHHFVEKDSTTTKFRVVFDGSAKTTTGFSLNDNLLIGPCIQNELLKILLRFREHSIVFSADIRKMYLQIGIQDSDQDYLRFFWRDDKRKPIKEYKYTVVPFGLSSSPFLAIRTLHQLASDGKEKYPIGAEVLMNDFYVDDCLSGSKDVQSALEKQDQLRHLLSSAHFDLRKWSSNHPDLLKSIPVEERETQLPLEIESTNHIKTLGILWNPATDNFSFKVILPVESVFTKRSVASYAAKTYDPTGLIQPVIILAKIILQELWESKIGWDEIIPDEINNRWKKYLNDLPHLENLYIPRHVMPNNPEKLIIHGFCDASKRAYGAAIYVVGITTDQVISSYLLTAKSKVTPLRVITIPRLELMGAVMVTRLMKNVLKTCRNSFEEIHYWSDSSIVLNQIQKPSRSFKTFVGNRVSYIQEHSDQINWHYVKSSENPADLVSKGECPSDLIKNRLWWHGPDWLKSSNVPIIPTPSCPKGSDLEQLPQLSSLTTETSKCWIDGTISKFNSLFKLKRVFALIQRLSRKNIAPRPVYPAWIKTGEINSAMEVCIKLIQAQHFRQELKWLKTSQEFPNGNRIKSLNPFIDLNGILRVGGRLIEANDIPVEMKHPVFLPKNHHIVELLIQDTHYRYKHAAPQLMMAMIKSEYWILGLKVSLNNCVRNCIKCQKVSAETESQMMGNLPKARISKARAFLHVGVDYAGPIHILPKSGRGQKTIKSWIAVFVCFATKAVHLELVSEMSTAAFIASLKRFSSRRGKPQVIYSDEGTNFTGARNEMLSFQEEMENIASHHTVAQALAHDGIEWKLNPPGSPHMGGLWEAAVKSMKHHLRRATTLYNFTIEEMTTLLCEIEACLNSRPLTPMSNDPNDLTVLTPGHFLIGEPLLAVPGPDLTQVKLNRLNRWEVIQQQKTHFWNRWSTEYLHTLQNRPKWHVPKINFKIGDLVIIKDESIAPLKWKMGRILEVHPGNDGQVRVATVKTVTVKIEPQNKSKKYLDKFKSNVSILKRPIHKLVRLPYDNPESLTPDTVTPRNTNQGESDQTD